MCQESLDAVTAHTLKYFCSCLVTNDLFRALKVCEVLYQEADGFLISLLVYSYLNRAFFPLTDTS